MFRRIVLLLAVAALMTMMVVAPASAQLFNGPLVETGDVGSGNTVGPLTGDGDQPLSHTLEDVTVQCVANDPLLGGGSPIVDFGGGDSCADDGGTVDQSGGLF